MSTSYEELCRQCFGINALVAPRQAGVAYNVCSEDRRQFAAGPPPDR